jgi:hypothetical protein
VIFPFNGQPPRLQCQYRGETGHWDDIDPVLLTENVSGATPLQATYFKCAWNDQALRVLFFANDTDPRATLTEHDAPLYNEDVVEVFLDPFGDLECYFEIEVNPLNAVCDLVLRRAPGGYKKDFGWHCEGLKTTVRVDRAENFWTAELSIPFASLGAQTPRNGDSWRANFYRIDRPENAPWELSAWSPTGRPLFHVQERFGFLEFVR